MTDLDDVQALRAVDASDMLDTVARLGEHARAGYALGSGVRPIPALDGITAVTYCGMGSSAVAGDAVRALFGSRLPVPVDVNRGPELPGYCASDTFVVAASYSGDTAETLEAFRTALARGCPVLALTSGGALASEAEAAGMPVVRVPGGLMPRASFGYFLFGLLGALEAAGLVPPVGHDVEEAVAEFDRLASELAPDRPSSSNAAKQLAASVDDRAGVFWGADGVGAIAAHRWRTQWNENAKLPAFASTMPELDHNEVVGWADATGRCFAVVALRHDTERPDVAARFGPSLEIARAAKAQVAEVRASGTTPLAQLCSLVILGDFTATYVGLMRGIDPSPIEAIVRLKAAIAEVVD